MDNFDKNLQNKLNELNEQDFEFKPAAWQRFQDHRAKEPNRKGVFYLWLKRNSTAAAIILLLLMSNIFFAHQSVSTRYEIEEIAKDFTSLTSDFEAYQQKNQVEQTKNSAKIESLASNLEWSNQTITTLSENNKIVSKVLQNQLSETQKQFDNYSYTIAFQSENESENESEGESRIDETSIFSNEEFIAAIEIPSLLSDKRASSRKIVDKIINNDYIDPVNAETGINGNILAETLEIEPTDRDLKYLEKQLFSLNILAFANDFDFGILPENTNPQKETSLNDKLILFGQKAKPTSHQLGFNTNLGFIAVQDDVQSVRDLQTGLNASTLFFDRLRVNAGINFWTQFYNYTNLDELSDDGLLVVMENLPIPVPVNVADAMNTIEGQVLGFSFPLTAQLLLGKKTAKWKPYIGLGVIGRYFNNYKFEYYFTDVNNIYNTYEVKYAAPIKQFDFSLFTSSIGLNYKISERLELDTSFNFSKSNKVQPIGITDLDQFGGQLNLKYNF